MKCKCRAKPEPEVTWFRGNTVIQQSSKISINASTVQEDVYELTLEIKVCTLFFLNFFIYIFHFMIIVLS